MSANSSVNICLPHSDKALVSNANTNHTSSSVVLCAPPKKVHNVPEPDSLAIFGLGLVLFGVILYVKGEYNKKFKK